MPKNKPTLAELVQVLDDGTTLYDILLDFGWAKKRQKTLQECEKKRYQRKKGKKVAQSLLDREKEKALEEVQDQPSGNQESGTEN